MMTFMWRSLEHDSHLGYFNTINLRIYKICLKITLNPRKRRYNSRDFVSNGRPLTNNVLTWCWNVKLSNINALLQWLLKEVTFSMSFALQEWEFCLIFDKFIDQCCGPVRITLRPTFPWNLRSGKKQWILTTFLSFFLSLSCICTSWVNLSWGWVIWDTCAIHRRSNTDVCLHFAWACKFTSFMCVYVLSIFSLSLSE